MIGFCIRQLTNDKLLLDMYREKKEVTLDVIKRRLLLCEREYYPEINDNLLQKALEYSIRDVHSVPEVFTKGLRWLATELLTEENNHLRVKSNRFRVWHETLTYCSPLLLLAAYSFKDGLVDPGIKYTALVPPQGIDSIIDEKGFYDLHLHLNGSTELDVLWQDALVFPEEYREYYKQAIEKNTLVQEQIEQVYPRLSDSTLLFQLLHEARSIRWFLVKVLLDNDSDISETAMGNPAEDYSIYQEKDIHPLSKNCKLLCTILGLVNKDYEGATSLQFEYWMYICVFRKLEQYVDQGSEKGQMLAKWFHHYLLILGTVNRMVVQQTNQYGFRQFQKITVNDIRSHIEKEYKARYQQLLTMDGDLNTPHVSRIEGRFSPKATPLKDYKLLKLINAGIKRSEVKDATDTHALTAHFIKEPPSGNDLMRYDKLRRSLWVKCLALDSVMHDDLLKEPLNSVKHPLVAVDAASSEFDTPPEVFAPIFRYLRNRYSNLHFTFHAGEDYYHPLSGLRAIYETITFLNFKEYDRIGHATALGIDPELWFSRMRRSLFISREEWLDDLLFCRYILDLSNSSLRRDIDNCVDKLSRGKDVDLLTQAWLARHWDPDCLNAVDFSSIDYFKQNELHLFLNQALGDDVRRELAAHWDMKLYKELNKPDLVDDSVITPEVISKVQKKVMELVCSKKIYLESLPTSNLRISVYKDYSEHHIKNWIGGENISKWPKVVLGTDDPGIFTTNIYYEYMHVAQMYDEKVRSDVINKIKDDSKELVDHMKKS